MLLAMLSLMAALSQADLKYLKDQAETRGFRLGRPAGIQLTADGSTALFLRSPPRSPANSLYAFDVASGAVRELITPEQVLGGAQEQLSPEERARRERMRVTTRGFTSFDLSRDGKLVLVTISGRAFVLPSAGGSAREIAAGKPIFDPRLSPDGTRMAFVSAHELWVADVASGSAQPLTAGAQPLLTHGEAEFVAQEELSRFSGYAWSSDSARLIYEEADARGVEKLWFGDPSRPEQPVEGEPYPRPGGANVKARFGIVGARGGETRFIRLEPRWEYVSQMSWQEGGPPTLTVLSRDQRDLALLEVDPATGATKALLSEHDDAWLNAERAYQWLHDGSGFLWSTESRGAWQLELRGRNGELVRELTPARPLFRGLLHVGNGRAVFTGAEDQPDAQLWSVALDGGDLRKLTRGPEPHVGVWARDAEAHAVITALLPGGSRAEVVRADGSKAGELPSVAEPVPFPVRASVQRLGDFWTVILRPRNFNPRRKYPVLVDVNGGPHANVVRPFGDWHVNYQWVADHGYIVVAADGRGTPWRGRDWERAIRDGFASVPLDDQVAALKLLAQREPAMDLTRVGIMGWTFGGFMAALSALRRSDVYKAALAGAPVVDWLDYDTAYTERYLGVPPPAGKSDAYQRNGLLPYVAGLKSPLLIVHGTADDNVHFVESLKLTHALFAAGKRFDFLPLSGQTHLLYQPELQARYWELVFNFFAQHL
ncbi:MAG TPA: prolyl oligopeptidase family serine peptidase [Myxococcales bacterium]|nr:prolyl oligopeptidase family serine peptidase [Myxococcales bacterium]